jgi:protein-tyrosine-phosphatase
MVVLFACVANSARSQLAEAIARHLGPSGLEVWSAGSRATNVKPEVRRVLDEIGIDSRGLRSKGFFSVPLDEIEVAVTLCQDEVCPVFPQPIRQEHWALPDPAAAPAAERLEAFRATRDELLRRIPILLASLGAPQA